MNLSQRRTPLAPSGSWLPQSLRAVPGAPTVAAALSAAAVSGVLSVATHGPAMVRVLVTRTMLTRGQVVRPRDLKSLILPASQVPPSALTRWPTPARVVYARTALPAGIPLTPQGISPFPPPPEPQLGAGEVAAAFTVPSTDLPMRPSPGTTVAVAGSFSDGAPETLIAMRVSVLAVRSVPSTALEPGGYQLILALPLPVALAAESAYRAGSLAILPWTFGVASEGNGGGAA